VISKVATMKDAVADLVRDGDTVAIEGFTHLICFAAGHEIIRQRKRDLTLARMTPDVVYDQMVGAGVAKKLIFSWLGNPGVGSLHAVRRRIEEPMQRFPAAVCGDVELNVEETVQKPLLDQRIMIGNLHMLPKGLLHSRAIPGIVELLARDADDAGLIGQLRVAVAMIQRRDELAHGQVAGAAVDNKVERRNGNDLGAHRSSFG